MCSIIKNKIITTIKNTASLAIGNHKGNQTQNQVSHSNAGFPKLHNFRTKNTMNVIIPIVVSGRALFT
jgi:hypothetical protein